MNRKNLESYNLKNERLISLTLGLETKSHSLSMTTSDLTSIAGKHFSFKVLSGLYFVNHLLVVCFHRRQSLASFSCNCCIVQCVSSGAEFDDDDDGEDAGEDDSDHDDDDGGADFDGGQGFVEALDV